MRAVVTRVLSASVEIEDKIHSSIGSGLLVLVGSEEGDSSSDYHYIADKVTNLRIFHDDEGKMNRSIRDVGGEILIVSQFTLLGDARKGRRPSFIRSGDPGEARSRYEEFLSEFEKEGMPFKTGVFQAEMKVASVNDGPVTILLDSRKVF